MSSAYNFDQNILIAKPGPYWLVKIADFGLSKDTYLSDPNTLERGTEAYMAPEVRKNELDFDEDGNNYFDQINPTVNMDLWSLGAILFLLLTQQKPFPDGRRLSKYVKAQMTNPDGVWASREASEWASKIESAEARDLVRQLLAVKPPDRISTRDACRHDWYTRFRFWSADNIVTEMKYEDAKKLIQTERQPQYRMSEANEETELQSLEAKREEIERKLMAISGQVTIG